MSEEPRFIHDCQDCKFLGNYNGEDLYFCAGYGGSSPTLIAREGNEGYDYVSGLGFAYSNPPHPALAEAFRRAIDRKYLSIVITKKGKR